MGRPRITPEQLNDLFRLKASQYASKYGVSIKTAYQLKHNYKKDIKELAMERDQGQGEQDERLSRIDELLRQSGIDLDDVAKINRVRVGSYEMIARDPDGEIRTHENRVTNIDFVPVTDEEDLQEQLIRQAPPVKITPTKLKRTKSKDKTAVIVPDLQGGYRRHGDELEPIHDERVVDVGLQIIRHAQPDLIVLNGDNIDFAELSHYMPDSDHFQQTMQATVDRVHEILAQMRANAPDAEIVYLSGNHEERLNKAILKHNMQLWGIRRPGSAENYPWLSVGHLMNLEELGVKYISGYPANRYLINDRLQAVHGDRVRSNGSTAPVYAKEEELSTIYGHVHRREAFARTNRLGRVVMGLSYGTWANTQGAVPSYGNGVDDEGRIVPRQENWQNGMGIIEYRDGDSPFQEHFIHIDHTEDYVTIWDRREFRPNES